MKYKNILILTFSSLLFLFTNNINTNIDKNLQLNSHLFTKLGYTREDYKYLTSIYNQKQLTFILQKEIPKNILYPYLNSKGFNLEEINSYEKIRQNTKVTHQGAINLKNHPNIMSNFYQDIKKAINIDNNLILVNKNYVLPKNYVPNDLIFAKDIRRLVDDKSRYYIKKEAYIALKNLFDEAQKNNLSLILSNAYRSYEKQQKIYEQYLINFSNADFFSARPGHSEHQTGLAVDLTCKEANYLLTEEFANTKEGIFIKQNAHKFGFIIRYPKDKTNITGYQYEPWHLRYVGKKIAKFIYQNDLTLEEYLVNYTYIPN